MLHIGMMGYESNNSFTPLIANELTKFGHMVTRFSIKKVREGISPYQLEDHMKYKKALSLRSGIAGWEGKLDFLIVAQSMIYWYNDLTMPVIYFHTELTSPLTVRGHSFDSLGWPTHIAMKLPEMENFIHSMDPWGWNAIKHHFNLWPAAHPPHYNPDYEKDWLVSYVGAPSDLFDRKRDFLWNEMQRSMKRIESYIVQKNLCNVVYDRTEMPADHYEYNITMARSQHMILTAHNGVYVGRRHFECLASKTIPIIWIENDECERFFLEDLGFVGKGNKPNCYFYRDEYELEDLLKGLEYDPEVAERGNELLLKTHTFGHRALTIMKVMDATTHKLDFKVRESNEKENTPLISKKDIMV